MEFSHIRNIQKVATIVIRNHKNFTRALKIVDKLIFEWIMIKNAMHTPRAT